MITNCVQVWQLLPLVCISIVHLGLERAFSAPVVVRAGDYELVTTKLAYRVHTVLKVHLSSRPPLLPLELRAKTAPWVTPDYIHAVIELNRSPAITMKLPPPIS
mmetsp:Transcript_10193/g.11988  ORF Transcript_10193/g.11988 Transcript_10193/m.11988 type:complete len:104 (-) Transcript_10193:231-542(-)